MWGFSTLTVILSESAATSLMSETAWALFSGPSSEANTVSVTGVESFSNCVLTACSSSAARNPMPGVYPLSAAWRLPTDDLQHPAVAARVDAGVDQRGPLRALGGDEGTREFRLVRRRPGRHAERAREGRQIGPRIAHGGARVALLLLLDLDERQRRVVEGDDGDGQAQAHGRLELRHDHHEAAVAGEAHHALLGTDELGRDGGRQREAHGGEPIRDQELSRFHRLPVFRGLEHVGARIYRRDSPRRGQLPGDLDHAVRSQPRHVDLERTLALAAESLHLDHVPVRMMLVESWRQLLEHGAQVADYLQGRSEVARSSVGGIPHWGGTAHEAQHGRGIAPAAWDQLHRVEAEGDDEVGAADRGLLER